jgi:hypothetical protein
MSEKMKILQMIENGELSPEEGIQRIQELEKNSSADEAMENQTALDILSKIETGEISADEGISFLTKPKPAQVELGAEDEDYEIPSAPPNIPEEELNRWKRWWKYPLYFGVGIVILSTLWLNSAYHNSGIGFWFICSLVPLSIGLLLMVLSWQSQGGPWIHVRVKGENERVAISIPAPLGITSWALRNFGHHIPQLEKTSVDEIIVALENTSKASSPLYVQVDEGEDGEKVEVFIG